MERRAGSPRAVLRGAAPHPMSGLNWTRLGNLGAREIISASGRDGFALRSQSGSHQRYAHPDGRRVTVSFHGPGETFAIKPLRSMVEVQARWTESDPRRLELLR